MIEKFPVRKIKHSSDNLTKRQREEKRRKELYSLPNSENAILDRRIDSMKTVKINKEMSLYEDILKKYIKIKNLMDYENEVKNQQNKLELEERRILLMHKNPKLARRLFDKKEELKEIEMRKTARRQAIQKISYVEAKYSTLDLK